MNERVLGKTNIFLSEIGYGAAALFGKDVFGKPGIDDEDAYELIETALNLGITFFDTGLNYGYAEERLGKCLKRAISNGITKRENVIIETKFGELLNEDGSYGQYCWKPEWIRKSLEISLDRLQMDYIDLFAMHGGSISDISDELINVINDLKAEGLIKAFGINTFDTEVINWIADNGVFDYVMIDYNIMKQDREGVIKSLYDDGIGVIAGCALGQALFSKNIYKIRSLNDFWYFARTILKFRNLLHKSKDFRFLNKYNQYTGNQLALRYVLDNSNISSAVFSTVDLQHLIENVESASISMPASIRAEIQKRA